MGLNVPNLLSILRMGLIPFFIIALTEGDVTKGLVIFAVAGVTDALDGFAARFWNQQTLLGTYLDPAADKLLLTTAYVMLTLESVAGVLAIPLWVTVLVITRDVLIVVLAAALYMAHDVKSFPPTKISKLTTVVQVVTVVLVLLVNSFAGFAGRHPLFVEVVEWSTYLVALLTVASGLFYLYHRNQLSADSPAD